MDSFLCGNGKIIIIILLALFSTKSYALDLTMPLNCNYGKDCFISNYFDHDSIPDIYKDHTCGFMSQDGYKSTDFILKNTALMKEGVNVVAGDSGIIKYLRDDIEDVNVELSGPEAVRGHECGNGIVIEHKRGYETQYCHLKKGSITVKRGDKVDKGQVIGEVGLSGMTSYPYLEFTVTMGGKALDPFTGEDAITGKAEVACDSLDIYPLWDKATEKKLTYITTAQLSSSFSTKVPNEQGARAGRYNAVKISNDSKLMYFWIDILGVLKGDKLKMTIVAPNGEIVYSSTKAFVSDKRHAYQFIGTKLDDNKKWQNGEYVGRGELTRGDAKAPPIIDSRTIVEVVEPAPKDTNIKADQNTKNK